MNSIKRIKDYSGKTILIVAFGMICCLSACAEKKVEVREDESVAQTAYIEHRVSYSGETLGLIAQWYTGKVANWNLIAQENPDLQPNRIIIGQIILVPQSLVVNSEVMPKSFVDSYLARVGGVAAPANDATVTNPADEAMKKSATDGAVGDVNDEGALEATGEAEVAVDEAVGAEQGWERAINEDETDAKEEAAEPVDDEEAERERLLNELLGE